MQFETLKLPTETFYFQQLVDYLRPLSLYLAAESARVVETEVRKFLETNEKPKFPIIVAMPILAYSYQAGGELAAEIRNPRPEENFAGFTVGEQQFEEALKSVLQRDYQQNPERIPS